MKKFISVFLVILLVFNLTAVTYAIMPGYVQSVEISGDETMTMYVGDKTVTRNVLPKESTSSTNTRFHIYSYDTNKEKAYPLEILIYKLTDSIVLNLEEIKSPPQQDVSNPEYEFFALIDLKTADENNLYPNINETQIEISTPSIGGGVIPNLGKNYKIYLINDDIKEEIPIISSDNNSLKFSISKLGKYVFYYDEYDKYVVKFYNDIPSEDSNENDLIYHKIENLRASDVVIFPELPQKDGYVFTGWKAWSGSGIYFTGPQPFTTLRNLSYFATWAPENEYEPINIELTSSEPIIKGREDGSKITLTTNYGIFAEDGQFPTEWQTAYDEQTDGWGRDAVISDWKSKWNIVGNDELIIKTATRIDDKTVEFTLSGNSTNKYSSTDIYIEFDSSLLMPEPYEADGEIIDWDDTKIKMDADGVRAKMYRSDTSVTLLKQSRPSTGGGGSRINRYTVTFDTNGGSLVANQTINSNAIAHKPDTPQKSEYIFSGWFTDKELTNEFDFNTRITKNTTLYAKWDIADTENHKIIFTIGENKASVFGEETQSDVPPVIENDRAFLPARFVAESLGAVVEWDSVARTVTITKDDIAIVITIDSHTALVNGKDITLDAPAFIENNRTYTPIRFIAESLGCTVTYNPDGQIITITK